MARRPKETTTRFGMTAERDTLQSNLASVLKRVEELVRAMGRIQDKSQPYPDAEVDCEQVLDEISQLATKALSGKEPT